jgi:ssDNA-binding Zn-finger/Zn-ribbon topoisomerase 1
MARNNYELAKVYGVSEAELNKALPCYMNQCTGHFVMRLNRKNLSRFFGCSRYPKCKATRSYESVEQQLMMDFLGELPDISYMEPWD